MATFINVTEKPPRYDFLDSKCIGRRCFEAVRTEARACCNNRMLRGCPTPLPPFEKAYADLNKRNGWRLVK